MATWHQSKRPVKLFHDTQWTIVTDPPNGLMTLMTFATQQSAEATLAMWKAGNRNPHSYILPPSSAASMGSRTKAARAAREWHSTASARREDNQ